MTETSQTQFNAVLQGEKYWLNPAFDTIEGNIDGFWKQTWAERFQSQVGALFAHDETLETELDRAGLVENRVERYRAGINLGGSYLLSERWSLGGSAGVQNNIYPGGENPDLMSLFASLNPTWQWNERNTLGASFGYSYASYDDGIIDRTASATLNWERRLAETRKLRVEAGYRYTTLGREVFSFRPFLRPNGTIGFLRIKDGERQTDSGFIFSVALDQAWSDRFKTTFSAGREHYNAADGSSTDRNYIRTISSYDLTERASLRGELGYDLSSVIGGAEEDEHLLRVAPVLSYRLTEHTSLRFGGSYEYVLEDQTNDSISRSRAKVWVGLTFDWPRLWASY
ncbi:MAG: hypothetical protein AB9873_12705 [Syntrophobacteraceae bacterium]